MSGFRSQGLSVCLEDIRPPPTAVWPFLVEMVISTNVVNEVNSSQQFIDPEEPQEIPWSYNPHSTGSAYYFIESGNKIRNARKFEIDMENDKHKKASNTWQWEKKFPEVNGKASTVLCHFFCPIHHHCYGFHIVDGSEGRKDQFLAMYCHLPKAPRWFFYDFACKAEE